MNVCFGHVVSISRGVHDLVEVISCELRCLSFKGREAVA
jgi:hypothetical protein